MLLNLNFIGGRWLPPLSGADFENRNPADTRDLIGRFPASSAEDAAAAVAAAAGAGPAWRAMPAPQRGLLLKRVGDLLTERKNDLADAMTREMGKPLTETRGDVQEAIDTAYYAASETRRLFGRTVPSELADKFNMTIRRPLGVCALISAWNFPVAVPTWKMFPALACGNTVVFKPSEDAPHSGALLVQVMEDAGFPGGVVNLVQGGGETGAALVGHPDVAAVSFTGSTETGAEIGAACARLHKRCSLEMGGKNPIIILDDADLDLALQGVLWGAFGTTGQRCTAASRLILHERIHDAFLEMLAPAAGALRLGDGRAEGTEVGPLINAAAREKVASYVRLGVEEGAALALGGEAPPDDPRLEHGHFFRPTIFTEVRPEMRIAREEIFGPVLSVLRVGGYDEAVRVANDCRFGLSSSIYTRDVRTAFRALHDLEAGITYINGPTIGAEAHMPFGGVKQTGNGHREGGWAVFDFYSETKTVYVDYSGRLQRAQIDLPE